VGNVPLAATPFLGRERVLGELTALLSRADTRLVTLTGSGGSGKTRLALRLAHAFAQDYGDGAWFVAFAEITDPQLIAPTISQTLGLDEQPDITPTQRLTEWLRSRSLLLVLDNLEQLAAHTAILGELLARCPHLRLLVTSREPLHLAGEQQYEVPVLQPADAVELFTARAHAVAPYLSVDPDLAGQISERLDRLPLAIELAAARTKTLPPTEILTRLQQRLPVLAAGPRDAPRRQHTLQATIDWSYQLLTRHEQQLFARLGVFSGGFTLPAAEAVCDADLDTLQALTDRSLIRVDDGRYAMLETLREYALAKLTETGLTDELRRRHAQWLVELLQPKSGWYTPRAAILAARPVRELDNLRSALEWAAASGEAETMAWLTDAASFWVWFSQGQFDEAERWIVKARENETELPPRLQAKVLDAARDLALLRGELGAGAALCERGLEIYRKIGDAQGVCFALTGRQELAAAQGDLPGARAALEEGIRIARANDVPGLIPIALNNLADIAIEEGNLNEARALCEEGLTLAESLAQTDATAVPLINLAHIANLQGRATDAATLARQAVNAALGHEDKRTAAGAVMEIAWPFATQAGASCVAIENVGLERGERSGSRVRGGRCYCRRSEAAPKPGAIWLSDTSPFRLKRGIAKASPDPGRHDPGHVRLCRNTYLRRV
jgi:predicted ATPase